MLKVYVNENLPKGKLGFPKTIGSKNTDELTLLHMHPNDYLVFMETLKEYYKINEEKQQKENPQEKD